MPSRKIPDEWRHKVKKGFPIRSKWIKGHEYAYQRLAAGRDPNTGKVWVKDWHLGAWRPSRPAPMMDLLDEKDLATITEAWKRGETVEWVQTYLQTAIGEMPAPDTIYKWFRKNGITRGKRITKRAEKRITAAVERVSKHMVTNRERKAAQARCRAQAQDWMRK